MFKNVSVYRLGPDWQSSTPQLEEALALTRFVPCGASQAVSIGWVEPRGQAHGPLVEAVAGHWLMKLMIESKAVPGEVVRRAAQEAIDQIEASTGRKPGKKECKTLREDALLALLPQAFPRQASVLVWIDPTARFLVTDAASQSKADEVVTALVRAQPGLALAPLHTQVAPQTAMAQWLTALQADELPAGLAVGRACELKSSAEDQAVVKYTRHDLATDEVRQHVAQGKLPTQLALNWDGRVSFVLSAALQLKKLEFDEGLFEKTSAEKDDRFDADAAIITGELSRLLPDLIDALGGELDLKGAASSAAVDEDPPF